MKIVIAPDSFKGTLSATEVCDCICKAAREVFNDAEIITLPVADGGEGTVESLLYALQCKQRVIPVQDPLGRTTNAMYGVFHETNAIMEMAQASGLTKVDEKERDVLHVNTYGTGQIVLDALQSGCKTIYMGLGGSATNDGGIGMLAALGVQFLDEQGKLVEPIPYNFMNIQKIDASHLKPEFATAKIIILCDVTNPLLGENGATYTFAKQKGAKVEQLQMLEGGMKHIYDVISKTMQVDVTNRAGAGAAGGLGAAFLAFSKAEMRSGIQEVLQILQFENRIENADLVITGEGKMDHQTLQGKVPYGVATICMKHHTPCMAITGCLKASANDMAKYGIQKIYAMANSQVSIEEAMANAKTICYQTAKKMFEELFFEKLKK